MCFNVGKALYKAFKKKKKKGTILFAYYNAVPVHSNSMLIKHISSLAQKKSITEVQALTLQIESFAEKKIFVIPNCINAPTKSDTFYNFFNKFQEAFAVKQHRKAIYVRICET